MQGSRGLHRELILGNISLLTIVDSDNTAFAIAGFLFYPTHCLYSLQQARIFLSSVFQVESQICKRRILEATEENSLLDSMLIKYEASSPRALKPGDADCTASNDKTLASSIFNTTIG